MRFSTVVKLEGRSATGLAVPDEVVTTLGGGQRPAVTVTIGPHTYRSTIARRGGVFMIPLSAENRMAADVAAGDEVAVDVELDRAPREVEVPADLAAALDADPAVRARFDRLSFTHRNEYVRAVEAAKAPETRQRRIAKTIEALTA